MTEAEKKAESYIKNKLCNHCPEKNNCKYECQYCMTIYIVYKDGYEQGEKEKECFPQKKDGTIDTCEVMKENEKLKDLLNRSNVRLAEEQIKNEELKKENDVLIDGLGCKTCSIHLEYENEELKKQIEKMKCCTNCKWHKVFCELQEPCEGYWNNWELAE